MKRWIFTLLLLPRLLLADPSPFTLITVPKSGSHMIIKALHLLTGSPPIWHTHFPSFWCIPQDQGFLYTHFCLTRELERNYQELPELKKIIAIRDLRDVAVSIVQQITKSPWPGLSPEQKNAYPHLSFEEQLLFVINYEYDIYDVAEFAPNSNQASLSKIAEQAIEYAEDPNNLVIRYEDLVGESGGGSADAQLNDLKRIAEFLRIGASATEIEDIATLLYGNQYDPFGKGGFEHYQSTFSKGKIGAWKDVFTEEHKLAFKKKLGKALIQLGYEEDDNW